MKENKPVNDELPNDPFPELQEVIARELLAYGLTFHRNLWHSRAADPFLGSKLL